MSEHNDIHGIIELLKKRGARITQPRKAVLEILCNTQRPVNVKELQDQLPDINIVTLYRILEYLVELKVVKELTHDPKEKFFELSDPYHEHHHHTICRSCGKVGDLECKLTLPTMSDFTPDMHVVTVYGICKRCN